jgi:uncharacterized protein
MRAEVTHDRDMFTINITSLKPGVDHFEFTPEPEALGLDPARFSSIIVKAKLDFQEGRLLVLLNAKATATLECDRTLQLFEQEIGDTYHLLFVPPEFMEHQADVYDEVRVLNPSDQSIDVTDAVRDTILLAVPHRKVAPGAEEEELETEFGAPEDRIDPRWDALRKLKSGASRE